MSQTDPDTLARLAEAYAAADAHQKHCLAETERVHRESVEWDELLREATHAARVAQSVLLDYAANGGK